MYYYFWNGFLNIYYIYLYYIFIFWCIIIFEMDRSRTIGAVQLVESLLAAGQRSGLLSRTQLHRRRPAAPFRWERGVQHATLFDARPGAKAPVSSRYGRSSDPALPDGPPAARFAPRSLPAPGGERRQPHIVRRSLVPHFIRVAVSTRIRCPRLW